MKQKTLTIIFSMIFIIGIAGVSADRIISNTDGIYIQDFVAGDTATANFSFDYFDIPDNKDNSPLIIKLDINSDDQINYPVWKNDFELDGYINKCTWTILGFCVLPSTVYFNCSEIAPLTIDHSIGSEIITNIPDGTFYCYNEEGDLDLNEHDDVFLDIKSHPALWPGQYNLTARFYYLNDTCDDNGNKGGGGGGSSSYWQCGEWGECIEEIQQRVCVDLNKNLPNRTEIKTCFPDFVPLSYEDKIKTENKETTLKESQSSKSFLTGAVTGVVDFAKITGAVIGTLGTEWTGVLIFILGIIGVFVFVKLKRK